MPDSVSTSDPRVEAHPLAPYTQHLSTCARVVSAEACSCGLQEAWAALDAVPAPDREKVAEAIEAAWEGRAYRPRESALVAAEAAIAAGAGSGHQELLDAAQAVLDAPRGYQRSDAMDRLRAAIAAGAGTGLTPEQAEGVLVALDFGVPDDEPDLIREARAKLRAIAAMRGGPG